MKRIAGLLIGLLIATNLYAEVGDLKVKGNLGVGAATPMDHDNFSKALDISGTSGAALYLRTTDAATRLTIGTSASQYYLYGYANSPMVFYTNHVEAMRISGDGKVGIGTPSPGARLSLGTSFVNTKLALYDDGSNYVGLGVQPGEFRFHVNSSGTDFKFYDAPTGNALLTIKGTGNVGIGTTGPNVPLHVWKNGSVESITLTSANNANMGIGFRTSGDAGTVQIYAANINSANATADLRIDTRGMGATPAVMIKDSGNVGIGNPAPNYKLDVAGIIRSSGGFVFPDGTTQTTAIGGSPTFTDVYTNGWFRNNTSLTGLYNQANANHFYSESGSTWTVTSNGSAYGGLKFRDNHQSTLRGRVYFDTSGFGLLHSGDGWGVRVTPSTTELFGNVGIGTTNVTGTLTVKAHNNGWDGGLNLISSDGSRTFKIHPEITAGYGLMLDGGGQGFSFYSGDVRFNGNVGIGTPTQAYKLEVNGGIGTAAIFHGSSTYGTPAAVWVDGNLSVGGSNNSVNYRLYVNGNVNVSGSVYSSGHLLTSDVKFKQDIAAIESPLDKVLKMRGTTYNWKTNEFKDKNFPGGKHHGVIAQELEQVLPEAVQTTAEGEKAVAYNEIIPVLIEAIKEQQTVIAKQNSDIEELKGLVNAMLSKTAK